MKLLGTVHTLKTIFTFILKYITCKASHKSGEGLSALCHIYNRFDYLIPHQAYMRKCFVPELSLGELILETRWSWHEYITGPEGLHTADQSSRPTINQIKAMKLKSTLKSASCWAPENDQILLI